MTWRETEAGKFGRMSRPAVQGHERLRLQERGSGWKPCGHVPVLLMITVNAKVAGLLETFPLEENPVGSCGFSS